MRVLWFGGGSRRSRDDSGGGGGQAILMLIALVFIILSPILAQLIYFALSRRREYLADASGAMYTRWPEGLASALEKLGASTQPQADQSKVTAPMYIVRPLRQGERRNLSAAFSTHPPLQERVRVLRSMGSSADFASYDRAFSKLTGKHVVGARTLGATEPVATHAPTPVPELTRPTERLRAASNAFLAGAGFRRIECSGCGAVLKVPGEKQGRVMACPRCGTTI
jgi:heat shock protein HtpX